LGCTVKKKAESKPEKYRYTVRCSGPRQYHTRGRGDRVNEGKTPVYYMRQALTLAAEALELGEFPIAAIVVLDDRIIARATASEQRERRYLGHAELVALEEADRQGLSVEERRAAKMFTTLEPCLMCMGAAMSFFLGELHYALESPGDGAEDLVKGWSRKEGDIPGYQLPKVTRGLLREESIGLFDKYVSLRAPGPMREWAETLTRLR
jgi:tRNA(adenine34) deaminase